MSTATITTNAAVAYAKALLAQGLKACEQRLAADPPSDYAFEDFTARMCWADGISLLLMQLGHHRQAKDVDAAIEVAVQQAREMCAIAREKAAGPAEGHVEGGAA